jgi:hypothetical protein
MTKAPNGSSDDPHPAPDPEATVQHWASAENESEADRQAVRTVLAFRMPVNFQDNALCDVLEFIASRAGLPIQVDWEALESIGVDPETPVSLSMPNALLSTVLDRVLADVSHPDVPAGWTVKDGSVVVTSDDEIRLRHTKVRVYAIGDLLRDMEASTGEPKAQEQIADELVASITELIDEPGWRNNGGETGTIERIGTSLSIRATESTHKQVKGLLEAARKCQMQEARGESTERDDDAADIDDAPGAEFRSGKFSIFTRLAENVDLAWRMGKLANAEVDEYADSDRRLPKVGGYTAKELRDEAEAAGETVSESRFRGIRNEANIPKGDQYRRFSNADIRRLADTVEAGSYRNRMVIASAWRALIVDKSA